jgi:hypothetical protein
LKEEIMENEEETGCNTLHSNSFSHSNKKLYVYDNKTIIKTIFLGKGRGEGIGGFFVS